MQAGTLAVSDVMAYTTRVVVNGEERPNIGWDVERELSGDLPAQVVASSGITQATGNITFTSTSDVSDGSANPFNASTGWIPAPGDHVQIFAGDGVTEWQQFEGVIDSPSGSIGGGFQATLIDQYDKLSAPFTHEPLLRVMPPATMGEPRRGVGLTTQYYITKALRTAGFYSTPPNEYDSALSVPCQGSMWPERGSFKEGGAFTSGGSHASFHDSPWGWSASNFLITYTPRTSRPMSDPVQLTAMVSQEHTGNFFLTTYYGPGASISLAISASRTAILRVGGTEVCRVVLGAATMVTALLKSGVVTLRTDLGAEASGAFAPTGASMSSILASGESGVRIAGMQASHPITSTHEFASLRWTPSAIPDLTPTTLMGFMDAGPAIQDTSCAEILSSISESTLTAMWIDETGIFRVAPSPGFQAEAPARSVTTLDDVLSLDWEASLLGSRSRVRVKGRRPAIDLGLWRNKIVYRGSGASLESGDTDEQFIGPDADEDWVMVDESLTVIGTGNWDEYNSNWQSVAGVFYSTTGDEVSDAGLSTTVTMEKVGVTKYKITHQAGAFPSGVTANLGTSPTSTALWARNQDKGLPRLNAMAKVTWADIEVIPTVPGGIGPELEHDASFWVNRRDSVELLERQGSYIQARTAVPKPTITGMEIIPDPRLKLGDVITIESKNLMGVTFDALIVGTRISASAGDLSQSLSVRIIRSSKTFQTYAEFNTALPGSTLTYAQWQALGPLPQTYAQFNTAE